MELRVGTRDDLTQCVSLFCSFFETHNRFGHGEDGVLEYLEGKFERDLLLVCEIDGLIKGALFLVNFGSSHDGSHKLWKFRHFAFESREIAHSLLEFAEGRVRGESTTAKIELTIAESEEGLDFYKQQGYVQEAALKDHYRWGEVCYVLGKSFGSQ